MAKNCFVLSLILAVCFAGCRKEGFPDAGGEHIKKIIKHQNGLFYGATFFSYDAQGRLIAYRDSADGMQIVKSLEYDAQGRLVKFSDSYYAENFHYDQHNRVTRKIFAVLSTGQAFKNTYAYDASGRLIADSSFDGDTGPLQTYRTFTYDGMGNVTEKKSFDTHHTFTGSVVYSYDRNPNYLHPADYFTFGGQDALSKNNRTSAYPGRVTYDYYSNGLPRKTTYHSGDGRYAVTEYYYE